MSYNLYEIIRDLQYTEEGTRYKSNANSLHGAIIIVSAVNNNAKVYGKTLKWEYHPNNKPKEGKIINLIGAAIKESWEMLPTKQKEDDYDGKNTSTN